MCKHIKIVNTQQSEEFIFIAGGILVNNVENEEDFNNDLRDIIKAQNGN